MSDREALTQARQGRLHDLHRHLTGHYGIHSDFRLADEETTLLRQNGFVVTQRLGAKSFGDLYYHLFNNDLPVFVTSDSLLHAWHHSYDAILMEVEENVLMVAFDDILTGMSQQLRAAQQAYGAGILADSLQDMDFYLSVALSLLHGNPVPTRLGEDPRVAATLQACAAEQMQSFPLFGCLRVMDFSQFKPRGHYEKSPALQRYFRAMMWAGRVDLRVAGGDDSRETTQRQLGAALILLDLLRRANKFTAWQQFDNLLQTFIGVTDSLTFAQLDAAVGRSDIPSLAAITDWTSLERLQADILRTEAGYQQIASDFFESAPNSSEQVTLPRSFTLMGQKFTLDSWALGQMVYDRVLWDEDKVMRRVPSCLDVAFAVLGNDQALPELIARMKDKDGRRYRDGLPYQHNLAALRALLDGQDEAVWETSLYTQWLYCLRALSTSTATAEYPEALRTQAWAAKSLNAQMASWTQLRHDTILYVKQSYTVSTVCFHPAGYVEPNSLFWERLERMAAQAADLLAQTVFPQPPASSQPDPSGRQGSAEYSWDTETLQAGRFLTRHSHQQGAASSRDIKAMQEKQVSFLRQFAQTVSTLRGIAAKQTAQTERSEEEKKFLQNVVQIVDTHGSGGGRHYNGWYPALFYAGREKCAEADALVADVHTDTPSQLPPDFGCVLHQGVGGVDLLVIAIEDGGEQVAFAGPTLSHYEFEMPGITRKSDSEWKSELAAGHFPARPAWTRKYLVAADHVPAPALVPTSESTLRPRKVTP